MFGRYSLGIERVKGRVPVVNDELADREAIQAHLRIGGYGVLAAEDGKAAVELAPGEQPDLIIMDLNVPGLNGYETCRRIRRFWMCRSSWLQVCQRTWPG